MSAQAPILKLDRVSKRFRSAAHADRSLFSSLLRPAGSPERKEVWALRDVSLEARAGEGLGIVGLNGAGKTTLLTIIAGITAATSGEVRVQGRLRSPFLAPGSALQGDLSVEDNVRLCGALLGLTSAELRERLGAILAFGGLEPHRLEKLGHLSLGFQQRVAFAAAFHADCDIMLVDEAMTAGDAPFQERCREAIDRLKREGCTLVLASHDLDLIREHCRRSVYLEGGRLRSSGETEDVLALYQEDCARLRAA